MKPVAVCSANEGRIARYESGGSKARKTHEAVWLDEAGNPRPVIFTPELVKEFRENPPDGCSLAPKPTPTPPQAGAGSGGTPANDEIETTAVAKAA